MTQADIKINRIFFCDEISQGSFNKLNITGYIHGNAIAINTSPYLFDTNIVVEGAVKKDLQATDLAISIELVDSLGKVITDDLGLVLSIPSVTDNATLILVGKAHLWIEYGSIKVRILHRDDLLFSKKFKIIPGDSPNISSSGKIDHSGTFSQNGSVSIEPIIRSASKELILIDQYLTPEALPDILKGIPNKTTIKILVSKRYKKAYESEISNLKKLAPSLQVKFNDRFHDRFIIVNGSEFFHFGHSLKDLLKGKVSRYDKITNKKEIDDLWALIQSEWQKS